MNAKYYTGVGSHVLEEIPQERLVDATAIAKECERFGLILRSGGAVGFDQAFEHGVMNTLHEVIYLPRGEQAGEQSYPPDLWDKATKMVYETHPYPPNAKRFINLLGRDVFQVLGDGLDEPSLFLTCWTRNGKDVGGTGTTMRIAKKFNVPIFNLHDMDREEILEKIRALL